MGGSRTVRTLTALLIAMTIGALVLMGLETDPVHPTAQPLAVLAPPPTGAAKVVYDTQVPIQPIKWRHAIVHAARDASAKLPAQCHFLIDRDASGDWQVRATPHWINQREALHVGGRWQDNSIGVCLIGEFAQVGPEDGQFALLIDLVHTLQEVLNISADRVYLYSDIVARAPSPGAAFPAAKFSGQLLRPSGR